MNALGKLLESWVGPYLTSPLLSSIFGTVTTLALAMVTSLAIYRFLQSVARRLSPGPVFLFGALVTGTIYAVLLVYLAAVGKSFEQGVVDWLSGATGLPLEALGAARGPLLLSLFYALVQLVYLVVVVAAAWLFGLFSGEDGGGVVRAIEEELGTSLAMRFYKLAGYHRPDAPEKRFHAWAEPLTRALGWAKWLSLPGALTGALPPALWVASAVMHDGLKRNLTPPPAEPQEEEREAETTEQVADAVRDPSLLVQALQKDPRGPELTILGGGELHGRAEHAAQTTRIKEESRLFADVLDQLGIEGFYVHQEAAAEAILDGKDVLMETPPLSGRRTLCDVLAMRAVLLEGGTALYLSPNRRESARRAKAFADIAQRSNWRWAIYHHDLADKGREGLDLKLRQPQIVFTTAGDLHDDLCRLHLDWDYFLSSLALVVAIDLDRYGGPRGANLTYLMRRLSRVARAAGSDPRVLATVAPFGPDVQGFAERLVGRPLTTVGPESDSRGAPPQYVVVGTGSPAKALHPAVASRGVAIACGYQAEIWGHGELLTDFEQEQQVNKVLLEFSRAQVATSDDGDLRFDQADALVARMSSGEAAMIPFFTRHVGRAALGVTSLSALEVGERRGEGPARPDSPFAGFARFAESADVGKKGDAPADPDASAEEPPEAEEGAEDAAEEAAPEESEADAALAQALQQNPSVAVAVWLADDDSFSRYLARHPAVVHPQHKDAMMKLGSKLVASPDNAAITVRHLLCAASETPITRREAAEAFSTAALDAVLGAAVGRDSADDELTVPERLVQRPRLVLDEDGRVATRDELVLDGELLSRGSTEVASVDCATLVNRSGGETILTTDERRILAVAYPGRILVRNGRRYRVLLPDEQQRLEEGVVLAEPERRRITSNRVRRVAAPVTGQGHELSLGGRQPLHLHHERLRVTETVLGVRYRQPARGYDDQLRYDVPIEVELPTRAAVARLPEAPPEALQALEQLARVCLPAFVRHDEEDLDVVAQDGALLFVDRHPGSTGYARAITSGVLRHVLHWSRVLVEDCRTPGCEDADGCLDCVQGAPRLAPDDTPRASRRAARALLAEVLGPRA